jgi:hypothetical protein
VRRVALAAALAAVVVAGFLLRDGLPDDAGATVLVVVGIGLAAVPPVLLVLLAEALRALAELPERIRETPQRGLEHADELRELGERARRARGVLGVPVLLWRLGRLTASARELAAPYAGALPLLSLPFLGWSVVAGLAALVEMATALVLLVLIGTGV